MTTEMDMLQCALALMSQENEPIGFKVQGLRPAPFRFLRLVYYSTDGKEKVGKTSQ